MGGGGMAGAVGGGVPRAAVPMRQGTPASLSAQDELTTLRQQADAMAQQTQQIHDRIRQLEEQGQTGALAARVEAKNCTGCGLCVEECPVEAIRLDGGVAVVDEGTCTACGACVTACPSGAIALA